MKWSCFYILLDCILACVGQFELHFVTPAKPHTTTPKSPVGAFDPNCRDQKDNCHLYGEASCKEPYVGWAKNNCQNYCGFCKGPTTPAPTCEDKLDDCEAYDKSSCTLEKYRSWAEENCRRTCRLCSANVLAVLDSLKTTVPPSACVDKLDCRPFGKAACGDPYKSWAKENCIKYCGFCVGLPEPPKICHDKQQNCASYQADMCTSPDYKIWAEDNCNKFCGFCSIQTTVVHHIPTPPNPHGRKRRLSKRDTRSSNVADFIAGDATPPLIVPNECVDNPQFNCHLEPDVCRDRDLAELFCPASCGLCTVPHTSISPETSPTSIHHTTSVPYTSTSPETTPTSVHPTTSVPHTSTSSETSPTSVHHTTSVPHTSTSSETSPTSVHHTTSATTTPRCEDKIDYCSNFEKEICHSPGYTDYMREHCSKYCTFCDDTMPSNCEDTVLHCDRLGFVTCQNPAYKDFMEKHCQKFCHFCTPQVTSITTETTPIDGHNTVTPQITSTTPVTTPIAGHHSVTPASTCEDAINDCDKFGFETCHLQAYFDYMSKHCRKFCNFCTVESTVSTQTTALHSSTNTPTGKTPGSQTVTTESTVTAITESSTVDVEVTTAAGVESSTAHVSEAHSKPSTESVTSSGTESTTESASHSTTSFTESTTENFKSTTMPVSESTSTLSSTTVTTMKPTPSNTTCRPGADAPDCLKLDDEFCFGFYEPYALKYCPIRCGYCPGIEPPCEDTLTNCDAYDLKTVCMDHRYGEWSRVNCRKSCNTYGRFCGVPTYIPQKDPGKINMSLTDALDIGKIYGVCYDNNDGNCSHYHGSACCGVYKPWAKQTCPHRCGYCGEPEKCKDEYSNCNAYGKQFCQEPKYHAFAKLKCKKYCNLCATPTCGEQNTTIPHVPSTTDTPVSTVTPPVVTTQTYNTRCSADEQAENCERIEDEFCFGIYEPFAREYCAIRCGYCPGVKPRCDDKRLDCDAYNLSSVCVDPRYRTWSRENCRKSCNNFYPFCSVPTYRPPKGSELHNSSIDLNFIDIYGTCYEDPQEECFKLPDEQCCGDYMPLAKRRCPQRCGFCKEPPKCEDTRDDCHMFKDQACQNPTQLDSMRKNCRKYCGLCAIPHC